ncbi:hypothetical protein V1477_016180 [Vespula maculifrons]|uniref:Uncharacterized protein n=2 Tax=Vespula TaxID=7451 RepID=A0A834K7L4_VESVU|nr:hypothetical protein HZH66_006703 [Vespula vulgaris]
MRRERAVNASSVNDFSSVVARTIRKPANTGRNHTAPTPPSPVPTSSFTERDRGLANRQQRFKIAPCHDEDEVTKLLQREKSVELT